MAGFKFHSSNIGCILMASGHSKRYGSNKLLAKVNNKALIEYSFSATDFPILKRITVTRYEEVCELSRSCSIPYLLHSLENRNDTIRLGLSALLSNNNLAGCMFVNCDQPFIKSQSIKHLCEAFTNNPDRICRLSYNNIPGNPVIFPSAYFDELLNLPEKCGGSHIIKKYPEQVLFVPIQDIKEFYDIDTKEDLNSLL